MSRHLAHVSAAATIAGALLLGACREEPVRTYTIVKERAPAPAAAPAADMAAMNLPGFAAQGSPGATWTAPAHWQQQPAGSVRIGSYKIVGADNNTADFSITAFPGDVGGDLANVNRWRQQIGLPPIAAAELGAALRAVNAPAGTFFVANFVNTAQPAIRVLAALKKQPDRTWFFKLAGADALVGAEESGFLALLQSVQFSAAAAAGPAPAAFAPPPANASSTNALPPGHPPIGGLNPAPAGLPDGHPPLGGASPAANAPAPATATAATGLPIAWAAPDNWVAKPLGAMRRGSFTVKSDAGGEADCSVIVLGAAANPLLDNVNRWRGQVALPPLGAAQLPAETTTLETHGLRIAVVDLAGTQPGSATPARILGGILYLGEEAWFFKLSGPDAVVAAEKPAFLQFLRTVRPSN